MVPGALGEQPAPMPKANMCTMLPFSGLGRPLVSEVVEPKGYLLAHAAVRVDQHDTGFIDQTTDFLYWLTRLAAQAQHGRELGPGHTEQQFVVVAAGQRATPVATPAFNFYRCRQRQMSKFDPRTQAAGRTDMTEVGHQAVGYIDGSVGATGQQTPQCHPRCRAFEPLPEIHGIGRFQCRTLQGQPGVAYVTAQEEMIARPSATPFQDGGRIHESDYLHCDAERPPGGVATDELDAVLRGQGRETCYKGP